MLNAYEQHLLASYLVNVASSLHHRDPEASELAAGVAGKASRLARGRNRRRFRRHGVGEDHEEGMSASKLRSLRETLRAALLATGKPCGDRPAVRLRRLGRTLGLTRTDFDILDRLLHHSHVLSIKGRSYRLLDLEQAIGSRPSTAPPRWHHNGA